MERPRSRGEGAGRPPKTVDGLRGRNNPALREERGVFLLIAFRVHGERNPHRRADLSVRPDLGPTPSGAPGRGSRSFVTIGSEWKAKTRPSGSRAGRSFCALFTRVLSSGAERRASTPETRARFPQDAPNEESGIRNPEDGGRGPATGGVSKTLQRGAAPRRPATFEESGIENRESGDDAARAPGIPAGGS